MDFISYSQGDWLTDKIWGIAAGTVRDDEHKGGEREQFTGNLICSYTHGKAGVKHG